MHQSSQTATLRRLSSKINSELEGVSQGVDREVGASRAITQNEEA